MFEHSAGTTVEAINFRSIAHDDDDDDDRIQCKSPAEDAQAKAGRICRPRQLKRRPAVILENVSFSVDKSNQQADFLHRLTGQVRNSLCFCPSEDKINILKSVNLNVPSGSIFGLLGPSSCGKTTLLRCLVGLLVPTSGSIKLLGDQDERRNHNRQIKSYYRSEKCQIPGPNVGYMPQDLGLYEDFTIDELLTMFGKYVRMDGQLLNSRIAFMSKFLDLPHTSRQVATLSGGQKRRVSFAIACLHKPPLIILDEPTVGVDPLLRQSIWKYLRRMASDDHCTIIITTHYIEEASQADQVAFMRAGEILVQDSPREIMRANGSSSLEDAFLKICNHVEVGQKAQSGQMKGSRMKDLSQIHFCLDPDENIGNEKRDESCTVHCTIKKLGSRPRGRDKINSSDLMIGEDALSPRLSRLGGFSSGSRNSINKSPCYEQGEGLTNCETNGRVIPKIKYFKLKRSNRLDFVSTQELYDKKSTVEAIRKNCDQLEYENLIGSSNPSIGRQFLHNISLFFSLIHKNYKRNLNSWPLLAFQFLLPIIQMVSFSVCVGGKPTDIGLGVVNHDKPLDYVLADQPNVGLAGASLFGNSADVDNHAATSMSETYLGFLDKSLFRIQAYDNIQSALDGVRQAKLWAAMEIGENFTESVSKRFDFENIYQLESETIDQSVIRLFTDRSNKIIDLICQRSLIQSYRSFLVNQFDHLKRLPIEVREPVFDIEPNLISNSIDGYTESIAPGLLASLTYIMAAGLTTFIMVVERGSGILERTYTCGISPFVYLLAHATFRCIVMMVQIGIIMIVTFSILQQPIEGSLPLAYIILMLLNVTGISYGLLISSLVTDQNGAALTIVSSLVVKITLSGILWPFEAIPRWLRVICYIQPLTMPVKALKVITLKGGGLEDQTVLLGLLVSVCWFILFISVATRRFKFYQH